MVLENIRGQDFKLLLNFMYHGQIDIPREDMDSIFDAAKFLKIRGLTKASSESCSLRKRKSLPKVRFISNSEAIPNLWNELWLRQNHDSNWLQSQEISRNSNPKAYSSQDMQSALDSLKEGKLSLTRASEAFKIPATTLWQRANKLGIATPKKESVNKTWSDTKLNVALDALRKRELSANKASKMYGIPSSVSFVYKKSTKNTTGKGNDEN